MYGEKTLPVAQERDDAPFAELFRAEYVTVYRYFCLLYTSDAADE